MLIFAPLLLTLIILQHEICTVSVWLSLILIAVCKLLYDNLFFSFAYFIWLQGGKTSPFIIIIKRTKINVFILLREHNEFTKNKEIILNHEPFFPYARHEAEVYVLFLPL
jgi:hypothetical protein